MMENIQLAMEKRKSFESPLERVVMISRFMNAKDIETIKALFKKVQFVILDTIMLREYLFFNITSKTKEETIGEMISKIKQYFPLPSDFYEQVMDCEAKTSTEFEGKITIAHPLSTADLPGFIAIARHENQFFGKENPYSTFS